MRWFPRVGGFAAAPVATVLRPVGAKSGYSMHVALYEIESPLAPAAGAAGLD